MLPRLTLLAALASLAVAEAAAAPAAAPSFPVWPFDRALSQALNSSGSDVLLLQRLLAARAAAWCGASWGPPAAAHFDAPTAACLAAFQAGAVPGVAPAARGALDAQTAAAVLRVLGPDGYVDDGAAPAASGHLYKVHVALPSANRSVEAVATLVAANGSALFSFVVRLHGAEGYPVPDWPSWNDSDSGLSQFAGDGATPTGLAEFDLNSPESNASEFGPYPVNRATNGLRGNWAVVSWNSASTLRSGILLHTGEWPGWAPPAPMPNSLGCIHAWPDSIERVWKTLVALGVDVRPNTNGALPYPYKPQGLLSVECPACQGAAAARARA
jgi:hypothetical protein